jgi:DNA polymerase-3 subunit delta'
LDERRMAWQDILGHEETVTTFRRAAEAGRLAGSYLFVGPAGIGKRTFAVELARALLCQTHSDEQLVACGHCAACQQVTAGSHPDLDMVGKPADRSFIPLELLIGDEEHRMREGFCRNISLKAYSGGRKIAILDDADYLNQEGANCLLKTLEEPPPRAVIILIGTSEQRQLPTIRSRCQIIRFRPLNSDQIATLLVRNGLVETEPEARQLSELSEGSLEQATHYLDSSIRDFRDQLFEFLANTDDPFAFAKDLSSFVDAAGKEAPPRRMRLKLVADMAADFYERLLARLHGYTQDADAGLQQALDRAVKTWNGSHGAAADCLERCLEVHAQIESNANLATLIESWLDDLAQLRYSAMA